MRKILFLLALLFPLVQVFSQRTITGTVTSADDGAPLPGVTVTAKAVAGVGTITKADGTYSIQVNDEVKTLVFSFIGMATQEFEIGNQTTIDVVMQSSDITVDDVVVTALGVTREERSLGYSVQEVSADDIAVKDAVSISNSLQGRIAGVQIKSAYGTVGGSSSVMIRGAASLGGTNQPLFVVDGTPISNFNNNNFYEGYDYGNGAQDINPDDVQSVSVLKGAAATTLYGNRGANGVIIITTKSGKKNQGLGVEVNSTTTFDKAYIFPDFQNEYGGGRSLDFFTFDYAASGLGPEWAKYDGQAIIPDAGRDESWGPKLEGQQVLQWDSFVPESENYNQTRPWVAHPDNYKDFFNTGVTLSNSVAITGGSEKSSFRLGYTNVNQKGVVPNSELKKNIVSFKGTNKLNDKIEVFANVNYIKQETKGLMRFGYHEGGENVVGALRIWTQRQVDVNLLRKYTYSDALGEQVGWNLRDMSDGRIYLRWSNNPFWSLDNIYAVNAKDRMYGNIGFKVQIMDGLSFTGTARTDYYTLLFNDRVGSGGTTTDYYGESTSTAYENNFEGLFNFNRKLTGDLNLNAVFGGNIRYSQSKDNDIGTVDGLVVENFFNVSNSVSPASSSSSFSERQTNSLFATASIGFKDMLYLDLSGRNDWSSTLPVDKNSYFYPSISASFVFSELLNQQNILSFGKFRAGYARVGSDTWAYRLYNSYALSSFGTTTTFTVDDVRNNPNLKNETTGEFEMGLETSFLNARVGAEFTYFNRKTFDQIFSLDVSGTTGYSSALINGGELQNTGFEMVLYGTPVKSADFSWDISFNYSSYKSKLNSLYGDLTEYEIASTSRVYVSAVVDGDYGVMYTRDGYSYDDQGNKLVDDAGYFVNSGEPTKIGNILPDFNGGIMNTFRYKAFTFSALVDFQVGGLVYSFGNQWSTKAGQTAMTVGNNDLGNPVRDLVADGGGIRSDGVFEPGTPNEGQPNDIYIDARLYYQHMNNYFVEHFIYDASYVKLRELKFGYTLPNSLTSKLKLRDVNISIVARNVALLHSNTDGFDPEQVNSISNAAFAFEGGSLPSSRSIGFNINLKF